MSIKASKTPLFVAGMASLITLCMLMSGAADTGRQEVLAQAPILLTALR